MEEKKEGSQVENIELELLLQAIYLHYGYDFRDYSRAHVKRRVMHHLRQEGLQNISQLQNEVLHHREAFERLVSDLSINVTEMFRNPDFYKSVREKVIPILKTYPFLKIWHAGCATGEEVFSFAIMLKEEGLLERTQIYATDFNPLVVDKARKGIFPIRYIKEYTANYQKAGGKESFSDYYHASDEWVVFHKSLSKNMVFSEHNLVSDSIFAEVNMIVCRNVLIYFNRVLQNKVLHLLHQSLVPGGFLALGTKESLMFSDDEKKYKVIDAKQKIFKKKHD
jgi:chemotaxis protein methyltransferase CheR